MGVPRLEDRNLFPPAGPNGQHVVTLDCADLARLKPGETIVARSAEPITVTIASPAPSLRLFRGGR